MIGIDALVVGAGVVGIAAARALRQAGLETVLVEREADFGQGVSARSSEVIHAGIYYPPGSAKARHCVRGRALLYEFCAARHIPHRRIGKIIVAAGDGEEEVLAGYAARGAANGVDDLQWLSGAAVRAREPAVRARAGLFSPSSGIVDSRALMLALLHDFEGGGGHWLRATALQRAAARPDGRLDAVLVDGTAVVTRWLVNAGGLDAPAVARCIDGLEPVHVPVPAFAIGHYYALAGSRPFRHLVYPVAPPGGLGVHVTLDLAGAVRFGPDLRWIDRVDYRFDDSRRDAFVAAIARWYPAIRAEDLVPAHTGIRPKIVGPGEPDADFRVQGPAEHGVAGLVNLFGIESPGLTAALSLAEDIAARVASA
ncbi:MAG: NAD(P)/FAD-dependent oxidoreductase [Sphingomonadales bacterium]|nr:NAD(P)/FAD-dependent oxidoreductase [Sphingomonadales bacterium]